MRCGAVKFPERLSMSSAINRQRAVRYLSGGRFRCMSHRFTEDILTFIFTESVQIFVVCSCYICGMPQVLKPCLNPFGCHPVGYKRRAKKWHVFITPTIPTADYDGRPDTCHCGVEQPHQSGAGGSLICPDKRGGRI